MGLRFVYGSYTGAENHARPVSLSIVPRLVNGFPVSHIWTLQCEVLLLVTPGEEPMSDLTTQAQALIDALAVHDGSGGLQFTTNGTDWSNTSHFLNATTDVGTVVPQPISLPASQLQYATELWVQVQIAAEYANTNFTQSLLRFDETVQITGEGGAETILRPQWNAASVRQQVKPYTDVEVIQSGTIVGKGSFPSLPNYLITESGARDVKVTRDSKSYVHDQAKIVEYVRSYSYRFTLNSHPGTLTPGTLAGAL